MANALVVVALSFHTIFSSFCNLLRRILYLRKVILAVFLFFFSHPLVFLFQMFLYFSPCPFVIFSRMVLHFIAESRRLLLPLATNKVSSQNSFRPRNLSHRHFSKKKILIYKHLHIHLHCIKIIYFPDLRSSTLYVR